MAKANVLARRIRAYARRMEELSHPSERDESERYHRMLLKAEAAFNAFLATRQKGPWAAFARAEAYD